MYESVWNQLYVLLHYSFSFLLLMVWIPKWVWKGKTPEDLGEQRMAGYLRIVFIYIVAGYVLVLLKLFEVLAILALLGLYGARKYLPRAAKAARVNLATAIGLFFYEVLDLGFRWKKTWRSTWSRWKQAWSAPWRGKGVAWWLTSLALLAVLGASAYLRFQNAVVEAAPAMSDGYVTLAWMKYIEQRVLFHDGIYPQGFHIILAYLHKFAAIDQLYILKMTGPFNGVLITYGLYFAVSRFSGNRWAGIASAVVYGLAGIPLHGGDWERQASTNSQEFAMVFVFPTFYFLAKYLQRGRRDDMWTGAAGLSVIGLVHTLIFAYAGMGLAIAMFVGVLLSLRTFGRRVWHLTLVGAVSVVIAVLPFGIGELLGSGLHGSSEDFLTSKVQVAPPHLHLYDYAALVSGGLVFLGFLVRRKPLREKAMELVAVGIIAATFVLYEYGGAVTQSLVLATRSGALWAMAIPFAMGLGLHTLLRPLWRMPGCRIVHAAACAALVVYIVKGTQLQPIDAYKMEWDHGVEQYLLIAKEYRPKTWMIVSQNEGYSLVLGNGYHMYLKDLVANYDPKLPALTHNGWDKADPSVPDDIFIYNEKQVFEVSKSNSIYSLLAPQYEQRKKDNEDLAKWMAIHQQYQSDAEVFYEDDTLRIYHLHKAQDPEAKQQQLWGKAHN